MLHIGNLNVTGCRRYVTGICMVGVRDMRAATICIRGTPDIHSARRWASGSSRTSAATAPSATTGTLYVLRRTSIPFIQCRLVNDVVGTVLHSALLVPCVRARARVFLNF